MEYSDISKTLDTTSESILPTQPDPNTGPLATITALILIVFFVVILYRLRFCRCRKSHFRGCCQAVYDSLCMCALERPQIHPL